MTGEFDLNTMLGGGARDPEVKQIPLDMLIPYHKHPFTLYEGEQLEDMVESIKENGVLSPLIVQPCGDKYEILIGHNRWNASKIAEKLTVPAIIKENLTEEEAEIYVIESNVLQRGFDGLKISEQARVIASRYKKMFSQGKRNDIIAELHGYDVTERYNSREIVGKEYAISRNTVARLVRIDKLTDALKEKVDEKELGIMAGVNLSYLSEEAQNIVCELTEQYKVDIKNAEELKLKAQERGKYFSREEIEEILKGEEKPDKGKSVKISKETYARYFPKGTKPEEIRETVERALELYFESSESTETEME